MWIAQDRHWRVTCLMIPERTLYRTNTNHDRDQIVRYSFLLIILCSTRRGDELNKLLDDTQENPIPYKYESRQKPDCTIKLLTDNIFFGALRWWIEEHRHWRVTDKYESRQRPDCANQLFTDNIVFDAPRWWIDQHRHWRVTCLMIPERTLYRTNATHDRD